MINVHVQVCLAVSDVLRQKKDFKTLAEMVSKCERGKFDKSIFQINNSKKNVDFVL